MTDYSYGIKVCKDCMGKLLELRSSKTTYGIMLCFALLLLWSRESIVLLVRTVVGFYTIGNYGDCSRLQNIYANHTAVMVQDAELSSKWFAITVFVAGTHMHRAATPAEPDVI